MNVNVFSFTSKGPHHENQDSFKIKTWIDSTVACVADGVGGGFYGDEASTLATEELIKNENYSIETLYKTVENIHTLISEKAKDYNCEGQMLTTFTGCYLSNDKLIGVHCGDSRLLLLRGNGIKQLTEDHTEVNMLIKSGKLSPEDAKTYPRKHVLNNALGISSDLKIDSFEFNLKKNDRILLTTDGVHGLISKRKLRDLSLESDSMKDLVNKVVSEIESLKADDNYTIIAIEVI